MDSMAWVNPCFSGSVYSTILILFRLLWWGEDWARLPEFYRGLDRQVVFNGQHRLLSIAQRKCEGFVLVLSHGTFVSCCIVSGTLSSNLTWQRPFCFCWWNFLAVFGVFGTSVGLPGSPNVCCQLWMVDSPGMTWLVKSETRVSQILVFQQLTSVQPNKKRSLDSWNLYNKSWQKTCTQTKSYGNM